MQLPNLKHDWDVKLEDGEYNYEGRVEICYNGIWGTVCGDGVTDNTAIVVAMQPTRIFTS